MRCIEAAAARRRLRIDRYNGNTLRRYHLPSGAIVAVRGQDRTAVALPAFCNHISVRCSRSEAARAIHNARRNLEAPSAATA